MTLLSNWYDEVEYLKMMDKVYTKQLEKEMTRTKMYLRARRALQMGLEDLNIHLSEEDIEIILDPIEVILTQPMQEDLEDQRRMYEDKS